MGHEDQAAHEVLVTFLIDSTYNAATKAWFIPSGTRLVGQWLPEQPDADIFDIQTAGIHWGIAASDVSLLCPLNKTWEHGVQARFATEDAALAKRQAEAGELEAAQRLYAQVLIERAACGASDVELADIRAERAALLLKIQKIDEAIAEYEQAARPYEALVYTDLQMFRLEHAQSAAILLVGLCSAYLATKDHTADKRRLVDRMLEMNKLIKKRYELKIALLLHIAELLSSLREHEQARTYLTQAVQFYSQQEHNMWRVEGLRMQIERLKQEIPSQAERSLSFTIQAATPDDLEVILNQLREYVPSLAVTRGIEAVGSSSGRRALQYTARLRLVITGNRASQKR